MRSPCYVGQWKEHDKLVATWHEVSRMQFATEGTCNAVGEHQAKAEPFARRLGRHKRLEHPLENIGRNCGTAIADGDAAARGLPLFLGRPDQDRLPLDALHGLSLIHISE